MNTKDLKSKVEHCLGEISVEEFLNDYWQKKPLLIRNAFPDMQSPISADELAGLSCEENINARLVLEKDGEYPWQAEHGPFEYSRFTELPDTHWSLLISDMEKYLPETRSLLKPFHFLPDWRMDDLMISYAPEGGSVGAHVDDYDVFLIQLSGQRLWKISENFSNDTIDDVDLRILKNFSAEQEWLCSAGDMLYMPPNIAHHGIAQSYSNEQGDNEDCMTASVGYRAPSLKTITSDYINFLNEHNHSTIRFTDKKPLIPEHHAEITDDTVSQFVDYLKQGLTLDHEQVRCWLGQYCSDNKAFEELSYEQDEIDYQELSDIAAKSTLLQSPYSHFLFSNSAKSTLLFVDGLSYETSKPFAELICNDEQIDFQQLKKIMTTEDENTLISLYNSGAIIAS